MITRCGCTDAEKESPEFHAKHGKPCHQPKSYETFDPTGTGWTMDAVIIYCGCGNPDSHSQQGAI